MFVFHCTHVRMSYVLNSYLLTYLHFTLLGWWSGVVVSATDLYIWDAVPPTGIHAVSCHVATDKLPAQDGNKFRSIFSDNLQPIATRGKKAHGTLLVDHHCGNGGSIKLAPLSVSYYNEINGGHIGRGLFEEGVLPAQYCPVVSALASINEVNLHRARLVLRWATVSGFNSIQVKTHELYIIKKRSNNSFICWRSECKAKLSKNI